MHIKKKKSGLMGRIFETWQLTAPEINKKCSVEMFVIDECCMYPRARTMINKEVVHLRISAEEVTPLFIDHQFLRTKNKINILLYMR